MTSRPVSGPRERPLRPALTARTEESARNFVAALFMALRTAQIHNPSNRAFENATGALLAAAEDLFHAAGPFSLKLVDDAVYFNRAPLRLEMSTFAMLRTLRAILASADLGGIEVMSPPSYATIKKLMLLFAVGAPEQMTTKADFAPQELGLLGPQQLGDGAVSVDVNRLALQCYAKLILALREQHARMDGEASAGAPPQFRAVRVIQDAIAVAAERPDLLLRLAVNNRGAEPRELLGANACVLAIVLGHALGLPRHDLVDLGIGTLFHEIGGALDLGADLHSTAARDITRTSLARLLAQSAPGTAAYRRALIIAEHRLPASRTPAPHPFARIAGVAVAFADLVCGCGSVSSTPLEAGAAVETMLVDPGARFDPDLLDLLMNVLRVFPAGVEVVLESGAHALVAGISPGAPFDRPVVTLLGGSGDPIDLAAGAAPEISGTPRHLGAAPRATPEMAERARAQAEAGRAPPMLSGSYITPVAEAEPPRLATSDLLVIADPYDLPMEAPVESAQPPVTGELETGRLIGGRYRVIDKIGAGGMATVYRVEHTLLLKQMALKLLNRQLSVLLPLVEERFILEARAVCQLDDPNIVRVTDFGQLEDGAMYLVMDLLEGIPLSHLQSLMPLPQLVDVVDQILSGLSHAHDNQLIHRDMKPDNVMLIRKGDRTQVKILDFGIAKLSEDQRVESGPQKLTRPGVVIGTLQYMSPEQAVGDPVDLRTDLYSVGVMLYQLLSGRVPFDDVSAMKILSRTIAEPPPPIDLSRFGPRAAAALQHVIDRALAKEREDRFPSANAFRNALRACLG